MMDDVQKAYWTEAKQLAKKGAIFATYAGLGGAAGYAGVELMRANSPSNLMDFAQNCSGALMVMFGGGASVGYAIGAIYTMGCSARNTINAVLRL